MRKVRRAFMEMCVPPVFSMRVFGLIRVFGDTIKCEEKTV
ncbi:hypothetical protein GCM10010230_68280 [Streptomyces narbonensis]|nr:hypothetical protein GCM10010230_68280 [Streptomyces narbonensis]